MLLNNIVIAARDLPPMVDFYKRLSGWPVLFENPGCTFLGTQKPHLVIHAVGPETEVAPPEGCMCLDFEVNDLTAEQARLEAAGLTVESRPNMLVLRDPAGNLIEITGAVTPQP